VKPRRIAVALATAAGLAAATLAATWGLLFVRPLPTIDGYYRFLGLHERGEVTRDVHGIPRIYAHDRHDLFFLQGYVTAQDRLAQMEALRASARATFIEPAGPLGIPPESVRIALDAYADGVNKLLAQHADARALPGELVLAGRRPSPWQATDSLAILAVQLRRGTVAATCVSTGAEAARKGHRLLAADLAFDGAAPGWYEIGVFGDDLRAIGISLPGVPGILAGHNGWIAWAGTGDGATRPYPALAALLDAAATRGGRLADVASREIGCVSERTVAAADASRAAALRDALAGARGLDLETLRALLGRPAAPVGGRVLVDLADVDTSRSAVSHGASGQRASPHFEDQVALWEVGQVHALPFTRGATGRTDGELVLRAR
jgi:acyl-homoserine lactone acylase PvdQ